MRAGLSRRAFLGAGLGALGAFLPRPVLASSPGSSRKFLFVFCPGGWDPLVVFSTLFNEHTDRATGATVALENGVTFVDAANRPRVRTFFESWGDRAAVVNGVQVSSLSHEVCTQIMMTGTSRGTVDDWTSILGAHADPSLPMPNVQIEGPVLPVLYADATVRVGGSGQLGDLLDGDAIVETDSPSSLAPEAVQALEDAFVRRRTEAFAGSAEAGWSADIAASGVLALDRVDQIRASSADVSFAPPDTTERAAGIVFDCFAQGLSRSGIIAVGAGGNGVWDTHYGNDIQESLFDTLFGSLDAILLDLATRPGTAGGTLLDETTIVVLSEMGRVPRLNGSGGKDHWTWTSAMLLGSGIRGGQVIGEWADDMTGKAVDLATGGVSSSGQTLQPGHLGATLLALADIDPGEYVDPDTGAVIEALLA